MGAVSEAECGWQCDWQGSSGLIMPCQTPLGDGQPLKHRSVIQSRERIGKGAKGRESCCKKTYKGVATERELVGSLLIQPRGRGPPEGPHGPLWAFGQAISPAPTAFL